jgi:chromosome partitioning protein
MKIVIGHIKGGTGKSTLAINLAVQLQAQGDDVLLVDADPSVHTSSVWAADREEMGLKPIQAVQKTGSLHRSLDEFASKYDHVIVDAPGKDSREMRTALTAADLLICPMRSSQPDLDSTQELLTTVEEAREYNPHLGVMGVLNFVSTNVFTREREEAEEYLEQFENFRLADTVLHQRKAYRDAIAEGKGVVEGSDGKAKAEIQLLTKEAAQWQ